MTIWQNALSVRGPLIGLISLILVIGFATTSLVNYQVSKQNLRASIVENELPLTSNNIYSEIQRDLIQPIFIASMMANDTFVKDWLLDGEQEQYKMVRYLSEIRNKYNVFTSFLVSEKTRKYYHFSGISQVVSEEDPADAWYFRVRDMAEDHELNVAPNAEAGDVMTVFVNQKVYDNDGNYLAATGVGLDFSTVARVIEHYRDQFKRNVYFVNEKGEIMIRSHGAAVSEKTLWDAPGMRNVAKAIMTSDHGFYEYQRDGETMLLSTRLIPEMKWRVIVELRESDALKSIRQTLFTNLIVGGIVILLTLVIIAYTVNLFHNRLENMAQTDRLTGTANRSMFEITLGQAIKRHHRDKKPFSLIMFDIDYFKRINDTLGHLAGDKVIKDISDLIKGAMREADTLCRWGGEEYVLLANDCDMDNAIPLANKIRLLVEETSIIDDPSLHAITISAGIAESQVGDTADTILNRADQCLYRAKKEGRNRVCAT